MQPTATMVADLPNSDRVPDGTEVLPTLAMEIAALKKKWIGQHEAVSRCSHASVRTGLAWRAGRAALMLSARIMIFRAIMFRS
jgi:hypothetical protein